MPRKLSRPGALTRFFGGSTYLFRGMGTLLAGSGMRRWAVCPLLINALVFSLVMVGGVWVAAHYASQLSETTWGVLWGSLAGVLAFLMILIVCFFTFGLVAPVFAAPFNELLSQHTEMRITGTTGEFKDRAFAAEMLRALWSAIKMFMLEMTVVLPAMLLLLIPFLGAVLFALPAGFFIALAYLDYPLDRRKLGVRRKLAFCRRHTADVMGFGILTYLVTMVPFVNVLMIPVAAVGATRLFLDLAGRDPELSYAPSPAPAEGVALGASAGAPPGEAAESSSPAESFEASRDPRSPSGAV